MSAVLSAEQLPRHQDKQHFEIVAQVHAFPNDFPLITRRRRAVYGTRTNWNVIPLIALGHILVILGLLQLDSVRKQIKSATPLVVSLITETKLEKPLEATLAPKKLMMVHDVPTPILPPLIKIETAQTQPTITPTLARPAPDVKADSAKPQEIIPPDFTAAYLDNPAPAYPPMSKRMREQGTVLLRVLVNPEGRADKVEIQTSSGSSRLDTAAQNTVQKWRFAPAKQGVQAIASWVIVPIDFQLTS